MKNILTLLFLVFFLSVAYGQSETEKEPKQALEYYQNLEYAKALPIYEKYEVALMEAGKDDPELLKSIYTVFYTCYQGTGQSEKAQKYQKLISEVAPGQSKTEKEFLQAIKNYQAGQFAKALPIFEKYKEEYLLLIKYNDTETLGFYQALKTCYEQTGQPEKAQKYQKLITEIENSFPDTWERLNEKGGIAYQAGNYPEAQSYWEKAKIQAEKEFGKEHANYATSCNNLAFLYNNQGLYSKAEPLYREAKDIIEKVLGKEHPDYASSCNNLADLYKNQGLYAKAEPLFIEAKNIRLEVLGKQHPDYALSCNNLGSLYYSQGKYQQAEPLLVEAKNVIARSYGKEHPNYALYCNNLALLYNNQGLYTKARPLFIEAKNIVEKQFGKEHIDYALSCNNLALLYNNQGLYAKAKPLFIEAKNIFEKQFGKEHPDYATSCNNLAALYQAQGLYSQAEPLLLESKNIQAKVLGKEHPYYIATCNNLGTLYQLQGKYQQAESLFIEAKNTRAKVLGTEHPDYAQACGNLANVYQIQGKYEQAELLYIEAKNIQVKVLGKEHPEYAISCNNLAELYQVQGAYNKAESLYMEAKEIREKVLGNQHPDYAISCNNLAELYREQGAYNKAESLLIKAKNIVEKQFGKEHPEYTTSCANLALLYIDQGLYAQTEPLLIEAKNITAKVLGKEHPNYALYCNNLANLYLTQGFYTKAESLLIEAKNIVEKQLGREHPNYAKSCNGLGVLYNKQGLYAKAETLYIEAKSIQTKVFGKEHPEYATSCNNLGLLYGNQGNYAKALPLLIEAKNVTAKVLGKENPSYAKSCNSLGLVYEDLGRYQQAKELYIEAKNVTAKVLGKENPLYATSCSGLGLVFGKQGLYAEAEPLLIESKNIRAKILGTKHPSYAMSCNSLALFYNVQKKYEKARIFYLKAVQNKQTQINTLIPTMSEEERKQYIQSIKVFFTNFYIFTTEYYQEKPQIASDLFNLQILLKGLLFQSTQKMQRQILNSGNETLIQKYRDWKTKRQYLAYLLTLPLADKAKQGITPEKEAELQSAANQLEKELSQESEAFASAFDTQDYTWQDIQQKLKPNEAVIEMIRMRTFEKGKDTIYVALILTPQSQYPEMVVLENGQELEDKYLKNYRKMIQGETEDRDSYPQFWQNLTPALSKGEGVSKVYFSADGVYHQLNLETLYNPETQEYLGETLEIQLIGSSKDLVKTRRQGREAQPSTLIGFPDYQSSLQEPVLFEEVQTDKLPKTSNIQNLNPTAKGIDPLPQSKVEVEKISKVMQTQGLPVQSYLGKEASEGLLKKQKSPKVLHIATHGFYASMDSLDKQKVVKSQKRRKQTRDLDMDYKKVYAENPLLRSGLFLAGSERIYLGAKPVSGFEDGVLTAQEVMNLELDHTDLVVLSACKTGLGDVSVGEGVYGLQRSFQQAGAKTVLMSLWKVNDQVTQELLVLFYENWLGKKMPKREAFKEAKKQIQAKHPAPYFWGAFVMIGE